jgi:aspartate/methionine/tyrosine aminotransferase
MAARQAVAADYARRGLDVPADRIVLTASSSEAYSLVFKVLCNPGDEVLVPRPSYPLFTHLTRLESVNAVPYDLEYHGAWTIDDASVERAWSSRTRAVLMVSPNNPTGSFVTGGEIEALARRCGRDGAAIVADEVYADYELTEDAARIAGSALGAPEVLTFGLGGFSKSIGLPQVKLGWMAVAGPERAVADAMARLELVCDTYLSVSTPVQLAAGELFGRGASIRTQILARTRANYEQLRHWVAQSPACRVLPADGGWSAVLQVPTLEPEDDMAVTLLTRHGVLAHPGYFFDFPGGSYLVVSLLTPEDDFRDGIRRVLRHFDCLLPQRESL